MIDLNKFKKDGYFLMLALDHRGSIKKLMNPSDPETVTDEEITQLKSDLITALSDQFSGLLIDENFGLDAYPKHDRPYLLPLEKSSHTGLTELEYTASDLRNLGASGAKILIDFDPSSENSEAQIETARKVMENCKTEDFPLFLEIVTHNSDLVIPSLRMFMEAGIEPDVWKLEYPGSLENCQKLTVMCGETPWILLTGGQSFDEFKSELEIAAKSGVNGFLAGRSVWQEVCALSGEEKNKFLNETLKERFKLICDILLVEENAKQHPII